MKNNILVTASTGNIGSHIITRLEQSNANFKSGVNTADVAVNQVYIDFDQKENLEIAFQGFDTVFLLFPMHPKMVEWANNAVEAAQKANVKHLVRSSGAGADSTSAFFMPKVQGQIDDLITGSGITYTITRPSSFMQNFVNFFSHDIKQGVVYQPVGNGKMSWVDVRDIAAVNTQILLNLSTYENKRMVITGQENLSYSEALEIISNVINKPIRFVDVPTDAANEAMRKMGMSQFGIDMMSSLNKIIKAGYAEVTTNTVKDLTGKEPILFKEFALDNKANWI